MESKVPPPHTKRSWQVADERDAFARERREVMEAARQLQAEQQDLKSRMERLRDQQRQVGEMLRTERAKFGGESLPVTQEGSGLCRTTPLVQGVV